MADEPEATETTEKVEPSATEITTESPEEKPSETPDAEGDTPEAKSDGDTPEAKAETEGDDKPDEKPAKSAFDTLTESLTDPDEIEAVRARLAEKLPEDRRTPKEDTSAADALAANQRRGEQKRQNESKRDAALATINTHLKDRRTKFLSDDGTQADEYDNPLLTQAIDDIVAAEISLQDGSARETWSNALQTRLTEHGGEIPADRFKEIIADVAQNKVADGMIGAFLDELGDRRYQQGLAEGKEEAKTKDEMWRKTEAIAVRAEEMQKKELEPDTGVNRTGSTPTANTVEEYLALSPEDRERVVIASGGNK